jgi:hypothetical protein
MNPIRIDRSRGGESRGSRPRDATTNRYVTWSSAVSS